MASGQCEFPIPYSYSFDSFTSGIDGYFEPAGDYCIATLRSRWWCQVLMSVVQVVGSSARSAVGPCCMIAPLLNDDRGFLQAVSDLTVQALIT